MRYRWIVLLLLLVPAGCREEDGPLGGTGAGTLVVESDPANARITLDGRDTGLFTPDTLRQIGGVHEVRVRLDTAGVTYGYTAQVVVTGTEPMVLRGPLMARCQSQGAGCASAFQDTHSFGSLRFTTNALGALFLQDGQTSGLYWPATSSNGYMATGMPMFAARVGTQPLALGIYDTEFLAGRPAPEIELLGGGAAEVTQRTWILPPFDLVSLPVVRGMEVRERVITSTAQDGVLLVELTFRNITGDPLYSRVDNVQATTFADAFIGLALDPDIGSADDDWLSYDASLATVFAYDANLTEGGFSGSQAAPGLVGLRVLRAPAGSEVVLNGWVNTSQEQLDWSGRSSPGAGYNMLSGTSSYTPDFAGRTVGHLPPAPGDARISATVGPLQLAPGDSAKVVLGVVLASPSAGTFTPGQQVQPGSPDDDTRPLHAVAANLRARLVAAESLLPLLDD